MIAAFSSSLSSLNSLLNVHFFIINRSYEFFLALIVIFLVQFVSRAAIIHNARWEEEKQQQRRDGLKDIPDGRCRGDQDAHGVAAEELELPTAAATTKPTDLSRKHHRLRQRKTKER